MNNGFARHSEGDVTIDETNGCESASENLACFLALLEDELPDLAAVMAAWPELPEAIRAGILAMVKSAAR